MSWYLWWCHMQDQMLKWTKSERRVKRKKKTFLKRRRSGSRKLSSKPLIAFQRNFPRPEEYIYGLCRKEELIEPKIPPLLLLANPNDVLDMPVDPNEPTYCVCNQVSYGEMIGCDNNDVSLSKTYFSKAFILSVTDECVVLVSNRVVSFCVCRSDRQTERKVVLSSLQTRSLQIQVVSTVVVLAPVQPLLCWLYFTASFTRNTLFYSAVCVVLRSAKFIAFTA